MSDRPAARGLARIGPALAERDFALLWFALIGMGFGEQMLEVAIGWQVYTNHRSALYLGLIGLAEFIPMFVLALPAGHLADRFPRRLVLALSLLLSAAVAIGLALVSAAGVTAVAPFLALAVGAGVAMAVGTPAARALGPTLVPLALVPSAMTLRSIATQAALVGGPALGGLLYPLAPAVVYSVAAGICVLAALCSVAIRHRPDPSQAQDRTPGLAGVLAGIGFIARTQVLLGAISLDLFAVLLGGAVALLPLFARSILHVGPVGLGLLRSAPALGALVAAVILTRRPLHRRTGRTLLVVVGAFGASMIVFGLSRSYPLSFAALAASGFVDMFSMNIRATIAALATPDALRGRVMAVEMVFVSASNQLGAFESGLAAFLIGAVPAVVAGGALTVVLALCWGRLFPALAAVDRMEELQPVPSPGAEQLA
ncbi:MAG TPA: MFS transporter [Solirubrobacteraceae bacterium]|nr:MFS transporter [Solirubrobacteraceae bacterium]